MVWFWKKSSTPSSSSTFATPAVATVDAAVATAQAAASEWQRQAARQAREEKRAEKDRVRAARKAHKAAQKQTRRTRKAAQKQSKRVQKQARAVFKLQRKERQREAKRVKVAAAVARKDHAQRQRLLRKRQKEEARRRKQQLQQEATGETMPAVPTHPPLGDGATPLAAPAFKEAKRCATCHVFFQRLPSRGRHHCRNCGDSVCAKCLSGVKRAIPWFQLHKPQKVCFSCDVHVFNGMGGARCAATPAAPSTAPAPVPVAVAETAVASPPQSSSQSQPSPVLRSQRSCASFQSEHPEDSSPRLRRKVSVRLSRKGSLWSLPLRPLLKRKASADQLRNKAWDFDLRLEKEEMLARQRKAQMIVLGGAAPQLAQAS